jgi:uncharacterized phage-associated protein
VASSRGPVIEKLANSSHGGGPKGGDTHVVDDDESISAVVDEVICHYGSWSFRQLQELIQNQMPWLQAREGFLAVAC